ncbi:cAMP-dependent protein kinase type II regulatory subunit [Astathelohania contejeani]|uniref:cAMP-dependent protein kinase type II regulatory subunit n=1 Tax=Astathelohania contejeani TaxID=164912 RepID=A0ABQ7HYP8_9MICR|nr:cAMP-dependent protein kinase type II regulatory subunit [Thelohania contejeani]
MFKKVSREVDFYSLTTLNDDEIHTITNEILVMYSTLPPDQTNSDDIIVEITKRVLCCHGLLDPALDTPDPTMMTDPRKTIYDSFSSVRVLTPTKKTQEEREMLYNFIKSTFLFIILNGRQLENVIDNMDKKIVEVDEVLIKEGWDDSCMYFVESGVFEVFRKGKKLRDIHAGSVMGEIACLHYTKRTATVICKTRAAVWWIDREAFNEIKYNDEIRKKMVFEKLIKKKYPHADIEEVTKECSGVYYQAEDKINLQGKHLMCLFEGTIKVANEEIKVKKGSVIKRNGMAVTPIEGFIFPNLDKFTENNCNN